MCAVVASVVEAKSPMCTIEGKRFPGFAGRVVLRDTERNHLIYDGAIREGYGWSCYRETSATTGSWADCTQKDDHILLEARTWVLATLHARAVFNLPNISGYNFLNIEWEVAGVGNAYQVLYNKSSAYDNDLYIDKPKSGRRVAQLFLNERVQSRIEIGGRSSSNNNSMTAKIYKVWLSN